MQNYDRQRQTLHHARTAGWFKRFAREEDGSILILSLQIFIIMLVCTGIAIDIVRQEERRTLIQNTIDRAALAAASLEQKLDPKFVVKDYLVKAGLDYLSVDPKVEQSDTANGEILTWRSVSVSVKDDMPTLFGPLLGIKSLSAKGESQAKESVGNVEISLVVDISGSMTSRTDSGYTRIELLSSAAQEFVTQMFNTVQPPGMPEDRLSISLVPYNHNVVIGDDLDTVLNVSNDHTRNTCVDVEPLGWNSTSIAQDTPLLRTHYGDNYDNNFRNLDSYYRLDSYGNARGALGCEDDPDAAIMAFSTNAEALRSKIRTIASSAGGYTSIDIGARWGLALLDPAFQPATQALSTGGVVSDSMANRPMPFDTNGISIEKTALKVLVLMTDGENTKYYSLKKAYRSGASGLYSTRSSTYIAPFYQDRRGNVNPEWKQLYYYAPERAAPWYSFYTRTWYTSNELDSYTGYATRYPIDWETLWNDKRYPLQFVIDEFLKYPYAYLWNTYDPRRALYEEMGIQGETARKDANLRAICDVAKDNDHRITIYTVAMIDGLSSPSVLNDCATDTAHAYNVNASDLNNAFAGIAASITALRLTN